MQLREYVDDTEDYINIQLDNHRNQLIQLELFLSSGTVSISFYSLVTGIFGSHHFRTSKHLNLPIDNWFCTAQRSCWVMNPWRFMFTGTVPSRTDAEELVYMQVD
ncbi:hypothetical protein Taro_013208, partial [Colocasia esculenta]|nr:hypothetical protein [Colocasia esculenta]